MWRVTNDNCTHETANSYLNLCCCTKVVRPLWPKLINWLTWNLNWLISVPAWILLLLIYVYLVNVSNIWQLRKFFFFIVYITHNNLRQLTKSNIFLLFAINIMLAVSTYSNRMKKSSRLLDIIPLQEKFKNHRYFFEICYSVWMIDIEKYIKIGYGKSVRKKCFIHSKNISMSKKIKFSAV